MQTLYNINTCNICEIFNVCRYIYIHIPIVSQMSAEI